ncbi:MAG: DNA-3-methyladenine glycosylase [Bacteroidales bacterium]|nr:DNA-3-methyladenine glycosylase [Bacteroidales bacterium]
MLRLSSDFFTRDVLDVAPDLIGKILVRKVKSEIQKFIITETEAYRGREDLACHASKGLTPRTEVMFREGGVVYVYLIYGMYWMLNFVTEKEGNPQAVLIRGIENYNGPGKLTKFLGIDKSFYGEDLSISDRIWIEEGTSKINYKTTPRIGIDYAGEPWKNKPWRYVLTSIK